MHIISFQGTLEPLPDIPSSAAGDINEGFDADVEDNAGFSDLEEGDEENLTNEDSEFPKVEAVAENEEGADQGY